MSAHSPTVSIGLPVYNGEQFLAQALDSVLAQTVRDYELIISDNASTDRTAEICREYAARDPRIRYYRNANNMGAAFNYNRVFQLSRGEYFKWLADDDLCAPTFLERCLEMLEQRPDAILAYPKCQWIDENGGLFEDGAAAARSTPWPLNPAERFRHLLDEFTSNGGHSAAIYVFGLLRASAVRRVHPMGDYKGADLGFLAELSLYGTFVEVPEYLTFLRAGSGSASWRWMARPDEVMDFWNPAPKGGLAAAIFRFQRYWEYLRSVAQSPIGAVDKVLLLAYCLSLGPRRLHHRRTSAFAT